MKDIDGNDMVEWAAAFRTLAQDQPSGLKRQMVLSYADDVERFRKSVPCPYCEKGYTGLPGGACENCMNTRLKYPVATDLK